MVQQYKCMQCSKILEYDVEYCLSCAKDICEEHELDIKKEKVKENKVFNVVKQ